MITDCALLSIEDHRMVGTDGGWQEASTIMLADLFRCQLVERCVHPQNQILVLLPIEGQVVEFLRILLKIEKLDIVQICNMLEGMAAAASNLDAGRGAAKMESRRPYQRSGGGASPEVVRVAAK